MFKLIVERNFSLKIFVLAFNFFSSYSCTKSICMSFDIFLHCTLYKLFEELKFRKGGSYVLKTKNLLTTELPFFNM